MKAIRRSLKGEKDSKPHHISITPKSAIAILPPKKVIKAQFDYIPESGNTQELSFNKGDFLYVISREDDPDWYEACNPLIPSARGLVPVSFFEVIGKQERNSGVLNDIQKQEPHDSGFSDSGVQARTDLTNTTKEGARARMSSFAKGSGAMVYGVVKYDFLAERPDELQAQAGEAIIVIAQSNPEWFVAKPIGRLGGPGLIPVSFIELRDMTTGQAVTDPHEAVKRAGVPTVEEWKKMTAEYKNSSITLGKLESTGGSAPPNRPLSESAAREQVHPQNAGNRTSGHQSQQHLSQHPLQRQTSQQLLAPVSASIPRYCFDNDKYWYIIEAKMEDGRHWELLRYYHDFYDFQIALLTQFEEEAGNKGKPRTLPFMPGPVTHVTDAISNGRRQNLDEYIKQLLTMPPHISRCRLVRRLFAPRSGDFEIDPNAVDDYRLSGGSQQSSSHDVSQSASRHSSQGHLNPGTTGYPLPMASSGRAPVQRPQPPPQPNSASHSRTELPLQQMNRQPSSLTSLTQVSNTSSSGAIKVKVFFQDDIIAIRVPGDINFQQLQDKLKDRLKVNGEIIIQYKDEPTGSHVDILADNDLDMALQRNLKLTLYVYLAG